MNNEEPVCRLFFLVVDILANQCFVVLRITGKLTHQLFESLNFFQKLLEDTAFCLGWFINNTASPLGEAVIMRKAIFVINTI